MICSGANTTGRLPALPARHLQPAGAPQTANEFLAASFGRDQRAPAASERRLEEEGKLALVLRQRQPRAVKRSRASPGVATSRLPRKETNGGNRGFLRYVPSSHEA